MVGLTNRETEATYYTLTALSCKKSYFLNGNRKYTANLKKNNFFFLMASALSPPPFLMALPIGKYFFLMLRPS